MRRTWPDLRLRLVNAAYPREDSTREIARCRALATELGVDDMIEWMTDFLPEEQVLDLLGECDVVTSPLRPHGGSIERRAAHGARQRRTGCRDPRVHFR